MYLYISEVIIVKKLVKSLNIKIDVRDKVIFSGRRGVFKVGLFFLLMLVVRELMSDRIKF